MATQLKIRRGTTAEHASFTGAEGEITLDTTKDTLVAHDNYTAGGRPMLREDLDNLANNSIGPAKINKGSSLRNSVLRVNAAGNGVEFAYQGVLQTHTQSANYNYGTVGNSNDYHCSWLDISNITCIKSNSKWFFSGRVPTDDTNSSAYGVGLGFWAQKVSDSSSYWITRPANHEDYTGGGQDTYKVARSTILWDPEDSGRATNTPPNGWIVAGETYNFRLYIRNNNNNTQFFNGNDSNSHNQWFQVWEIA